MGNSLFSFSGAAIVLALAASAPDSVHGEPPRQWAPGHFPGPVRAQVQQVIDGDTIEVRAAIWIGQVPTIRVRINGVDAPELHGDCAKERAQADAARAYLVQRLGHGWVKLSDVRYDKYGGRVLADVADDRGDVAKALVAGRLARTYDGGKRQSWCAG
jgi:endonuclease YncB( thermonuclease family)